MNTITAQRATAQAKQPDSFEKGHAFENFIVTLFNKKKFHLLDWRSDKTALNGVFPLSSSHPDLEFACTGRKGHRFAVECKWRKEFKDGRIHWASGYQIGNYEGFQNQNRIPVLVAIGIGGEPSNPEKLFVTPLDHICKYPEVYESHLIPYKRNPEQSIDDTGQLKLF
jgi:hypothetical protein